MWTVYYIQHNQLIIFLSAQFKWRCSFRYSLIWVRLHRSHFARNSNTIVTWLILPVVICLSQRLSHACLSVNKFILWNCEWLIKSVIVYLIVTYYLDNRGNSAANTCVKSRLLEGMYLLDLSQPGKPVYWWFMIIFRIVWPCADDGSFKFLPYQLSMVG